MTNEERNRLISKKIKRFTEEITSGPDAKEKCQRYFIDVLGTHTEEGELTPQYGGPGWEKWLEENPTSFTRGPKAK